MMLTEFLLAHIDEDVATARDVGDAGWTYDGDYVLAELHGVAEVGPLSGVHMARWDPARVLAECAAKRSIIAAHPIHDAVHPGERPYCATCVEEPNNSLNFLWWPCPTLIALARPYAGHLGFDVNWLIVAAEVGS